MWAVNSTAEAETIRLQLQFNEKTELLSNTQKLYREGNEKDARELAAYKLVADTLSGPIKAVAEGRGLVNQRIGEVIAPLPASMYLTSITLSSGNIVVAGSAPSEDILLNYARDLRARGIFSMVMVTSVDKSSFIEIKFTLTITTG
jgi:hypothetical protein